MSSNVQAYIDAAKATSQELTTQASTAMQNAINLVLAFQPEQILYTPATIASTPTQPTAPTPIQDPIVQDWPAAPTLPSFTPFSAPADPTQPPSFTQTVPTLTDPSQPGALPGFYGSVPSINTSFAFPDPPAQLLNPMGDAPVLPTRTEPTAPQVSLPTFTSIAPADTTIAPTALDQTFASSYNGVSPSMVTAINGYVDGMLTKYNPQFAAQMSAIEAQLSKYLAGGTALNPAVENAIYERSRLRTDAEATRVRDGALKDFANRGFTIPPGALFSATQTARQAGADNNAQALREIVVKQAEMEQANLQFAVTTSASLRTTLLNASLSYMQNLTSINGQALEYAKNVVGALVQLYNVSVQMYSAKLDAYKTDAAVYETRLKAAMASIDLYKAQVESLQALAQVDHAKIEVYRARIESLNTLASVYRTQIEGAQGRANLEKLKLETFQAQVEAYSAQVRGKQAEWAGYTAAIEGQQAKVKTFEAQVAAYSSQVNSYRALIEANRAKIAANAENNEIVYKQYMAALTNYKTQVEIAQTKIGTNIKVSDFRLNSYYANLKANLDYLDTTYRFHKMNTDINIENASANMKATAAMASNHVEYGKTLASLGSANGDIFARLAGSAMAGLNTLAAETVAS